MLAAVENPLAVFSARSPGERGAGPLLSVKGEKPEERVLSSMRTRPPAPEVSAPDMLMPEALTPETLAGITDGGIPQDLPADEIGVLPGGYNPDVGPGGVPYPPDVIPVPGGAAVPEPATWVMLIAGFFSAGAALRRRRQRGPAPRAIGE
jgi:hypothetical protein